MCAIHDKALHMWGSITHGLGSCSWHTLCDAYQNKHWNLNLQFSDSWPASGQLRLRFDRGCGVVRKRWMLKTSPVAFIIKAKYSATRSRTIAFWAWQSQLEFGDRGWYTQTKCPTMCKPFSFPVCHIKCTKEAARRRRRRRLGSEGRTKILELMTPGSGGMGASTHWDSLF